MLLSSQMLIPPHNGNKPQPLGMSLRSHVFCKASAHHIEQQKADDIPRVWCLTVGVKYETQGSSPILSEERTTESIMTSTSDNEWMCASFLGGAQITIRMPKRTKVGLLDAALGGQSEARFCSRSAHAFG